MGGLIFDSVSEGSVYGVLLARLHLHGQNITAAGVCRRGGLSLHSGEFLWPLRRINMPHGFRGDVLLSLDFQVNSPWNIMLFFFHFLLGISLIYICNAIPKVPHSHPPPLPYPPTPLLWPWRSPVLGHIKFACPMGLSFQ
jgi:hypothetical protein